MTKTIIEGTVRGGSGNYWAIVQEDGSVGEYRRDAFPEWRDGMRIRITFEEIQP